MTDAPAFAETDRIATLTLDDAALPPPTHEIDQERRIAVFELLEENRFQLVEPGAPAGPYDVTVGVAERRLRLDVSSPEAAEPHRIEAPLGALKPLISDYFAVCDSYFDAVRRLPPSQIEALDNTRRSIHSDGSDALKARLAPKVAIDDATARRLFTVVGALVGPGAAEV